MNKLDKQLEACKKKFAKDLSKAIQDWVAEEVERAVKKARKAK